MIRKMLALVLLCAAAVAAAGEPSAGTCILGTKSYWRLHVTLLPAVFGTAGDAKPNPEGIPKMLPSRAFPRRRLLINESLPAITGGRDARLPEVSSSR